MRVTLTKHNNVSVLAFESGEVLDCYVASDVKAQAFRQLEDRSDLVLDLGNLEFVDSAGLGVLVGIYKRVKQRGCRVAVARVQPYVTRVMKVIKLDRVFESFPDVPAALEELSRSEAVDAGRRTPY
jgi:anti-anti-sigma factor